MSKRKKNSAHELLEFIKALPNLVEDKNYEVITQKSSYLAKKTDSYIAYNILGNSLLKSGKIRESTFYLEKSLELSNNFFLPAYKNLAKAYLKLGEHTSYEKLLMEAITRFPRETNLLDQLSNYYLKSQKYQRAEIYISLSNNVQQTTRKLVLLAKVNLEITKQDGSQAALKTTIANFHKAFQTISDNEKDNFYRFALDFYSSVRLYRYSSTDLKILYELLETDFWEPISKAIRKNYLNPFLAEISNKYEIFSEKTLIEIAELPLLKEILVLNPYPNLQVEKLLKKIRKSFLRSRNDMDNITTLFPLLESLAINSFLTEYLFYYDNHEKKELLKVKDSLEKQNDNEEKYAFNLLIMLCYQSIEKLTSKKIIGVLENYKHIKNILLDAPLRERKIRKSIKKFGEIAKTSKITKQQYEENPYPRWHHYVQKPSLKSFNDFLLTQELNPTKFVNFNDSEKNILIAGCGTGLNIFKVASGFPDAKITAVDLSLTSLGYAKRKIQEANLKNISFYHGDILQIEELGKTFDYIECGGVLHHIKNYLQAWNGLKACLKKNGVMRVGLYSRFARKSIINFRDKLNKNFIQMSQDQIIQQRQKIIENEQNYSFTKSMDFFSKSGVRDLILNAYEKQFDLLEIKKILNELNLDFLGIQIRKNDVETKFKKLFPKNEDWFMLDNWHKFEEEFPNTFIGMYQFWCQKN